MSKNPDDLLLNKDELELLSELMSASNDVASGDWEYNVNSSPKGESLLQELGSVDKLQLLANYGNHHLVFPVEIEKDDFAPLKMTLKPPEIFETGKTLRAWRFTAHDKKIYLINKAGDKQQFKIEDLSATGISFLIEPNGGSDFPAILDDVFIQLPNREKLAISGLHISRRDEKTVAYSLDEGVDPSVLTSLYEYLFECHVEQYPEVHKNTPQE